MSLADTMHAAGHLKAASEQASNGVDLRHNNGYKSYNCAASWHN